MITTARFNLAEISGSLRQTQLQFEEIVNTLDSHRESLTSESVANMVEGYCFIDRLLAQGIDLFAMGNSSLLLEVNALVLCGSDLDRRINYRLHLEQTTRKFYDDQLGGIGSLMEWFEFHAHDDLWKRAAGLYIQITSQPQLFIEGNHRSAILMVSYLLAQQGYPPFVLTQNNAKYLLDQSKSISEFRKSSLSTLVQLPKLRTQLAATLQSCLEPRHSIGAQMLR